MDLGLVTGLGDLLPDLGTCSQAHSYTLAQIKAETRPLWSSSSWKKVKNHQKKLVPGLRTCYRTRGICSWTRGLVPWSVYLLPEVTPILWHKWRMKRGRRSKNSIIKKLAPPDYGLFPGLGSSSRTRDLFCGLATHSYTLAQMKAERRPWRR
jgi:hypothetical protein